MRSLDVLYAFVATPAVFIVASWFGMLLCGIAAVTTQDKYCLVPHWLYQFSFVLLAFALGWGTVYGDDRNWSPWPPHVLLIFGMDLFLFLRIMRARVLTQRENNRRALTSYN